MIQAPGGTPSSIVSVSARSPDQEPASSEHHLLSARAQSSRSSTAGTEGVKVLANSRGVVSVPAAARKGSKPPLSVAPPTRCSRPSWRTCHQVQDLYWTLVNSTEFSWNH